jgi:tetratricopeptide (TPR) repeat protein
MLEDRVRRIGIILAGWLALASGSCYAQQAANAKAQLAQTALALEKQGKIAEAEAAWRSVVKAQPGNAEAFAHLGLLEAREEHYSQAIADYRKAQALKPAMSQLNLNMGLALFKSEDYPNAAKLFEAELKTHPGDQRLTILAGMSEYGQQHYAAAAPYLREAAARDAQNLQLRLTLAHCYLWTKQFEATMDVYKEILAIDPNSAEADMIAGEALDGKGDSNGAVAQFRAAVKANPKEPNVHFGLAYLLWTQKEYDAAESEFKAELVNDPKNSQAMVYMGDIYVRTGQFDKARTALEAAAALKASGSLVHLDLGIVYSETGDNIAAVKELQEAVVMEPDNVKAHFRLAKLYQSMGRKDEAKAEFAKTSSLNKQTDEGLHERIEAAGARPNKTPEPDKP